MMLDQRAGQNVLIDTKQILLCLYETDIIMKKGKQKNKKGSNKISW